MKQNLKNGFQMQKKNLKKNNPAGMVGCFFISILSDVSENFFMAIKSILICKKLSENFFTLSENFFYNVGKLFCDMDNSESKNKYVNMARTKLQKKKGINHKRKKS